MQHLTTETPKQTSKELLDSREPFFTKVSLYINTVFCGDERPSSEILEDYIHWFGGALNPAYNLDIMQEAQNPGSVKHSFEQRAAEVTSDLMEAGIKVGVHSDTQADPTGKLDTSKEDGSVGCGYAGLRREISTLIVDRAEEILTDAQKMRPELFQSEADTEAAFSVIRAHSALANRPDYLTSGRRVVLAAEKSGAVTMLVVGEHVAEDGIFNLDPNSSLRSGEAFLKGQATYDHDSGSLYQAYDRLSEKYPHDKRLMQIADLIDALGTMRALGVKRIAVRRPTAPTS